MYKPLPVSFQPVATQYGESLLCSTLPGLTLPASALPGATPHGSILPGQSLLGSTFPGSRRAPTCLAALLAAACLGMGPGALAQMGGAPGGMSASGKNLTGLWERSRGYSAGVLLTEAGQARTEGLTVMDDPEVFCEGYNVPRTSFASNTAVRMAEFPDRLEIYYEHNAAERVIYLDGETRTEATRMLGTSSGRREGDTIIIETDGFPDGLAHGATLVTSDDLKFLERYTLRPDGDTIEVLLMAVDPQTYEWPRISHAFWTRLPEDTFFYPSECEYDPEVHVPYYDPALLESSYIDPADD